MNFLQAHYNRYRDVGGDHTEYVVWNDISDVLSIELFHNYEELLVQRERVELADHYLQIYTGDLC